MQDFDIRIEGEFFFNYSFQANSKEEAFKEALQNVRDQAFPFDLIILGQYVDDEKFDKPIEVEEDPERWSVVRFGESVINLLSGD